MALRLTLPTPQVDVLLVVGTSDGDRSDDVAAQLDAHHFADGLAFLPAGLADEQHRRPGARRTRRRTRSSTEASPRSCSQATLRRAATPHAPEAAFGVGAFRHASAGSRARRAGGTGDGDGRCGPRPGATSSPR